MTLLPCPFCGGEAVIIRGGDRRQSCIAACTDCGCRHESCDEGAHSGAKWNTRADHRRCSTCKHGSEWRSNVWRCAVMLAVHKADFGCNLWDARDETV